MPNARKATLALLILVLALGACAQGTSRANRSNPDVLSRAEIDDSRASNLYDAIQRLRPRWLQVRGGTRSMDARSGVATHVLVYQDQTMLGDIEVLKQLTPGMIISLRYLDGPTASATLPGIGSRHVAGAIVIEAAPGR